MTYARADRAADGRRRRDLDVLPGRAELGRRLGAARGDRQGRRAPTARCASSAACSASRSASRPSPARAATPRPAAFSDGFVAAMGVSAGLSRARGDLRVRPASQAIAPGPLVAGGGGRPMTPHTVVRYNVKPGRAEQNAELVRAVYGELAGLGPAGFRYATYRLEDGRTFVHVASHDERGRVPAARDWPPSASSGPASRSAARRGRGSPGREAGRLGRVGLRGTSS